MNKPGEAPLLPLTLERLEVRRGGRLILGPVDARLDGMGISIVLGPNGSGKTTLLKAMHGLERPSTGRVIWNLPPQEARLRQAFVFQTPTILRRSVLDNVAYPLILRGVARDEARARAAEMAERIRLGALLAQPGTVLSGGEKQKLALARALVLSPEVLFLDEPCANLDNRATREIETILITARDAGTRVVMSTHDLGQARRLASEVWFLHDGRLCEVTPAPHYFDAPRSVEAQTHLRGDLLP